MITKIECTCGNQDPKKAKVYEGLLGYEAIICTECGKYQDHEGEHQADEFSMNFMTA